ncbi:MAG TPA: hypothetical protein VFX98_16930, partial [Longimicrobiaceae bacterium]|nr:hypothetical protein [Longimicrobiaceae bacterium]
MLTLEEFSAGLARWIGRPTPERPFVCEGSPLACRAFVVGSHPATMLDADFWEFWEPGYGFHKDAWLRAYEAQRLREG